MKPRNSSLALYRVMKSPLRCA